MVISEESLLKIYKDTNAHLCKQLDEYAYLLEKSQAALEFYANEDNYNEYTELAGDEGQYVKKCASVIYQDSGDKARKAISIKLIKLNVTEVLDE